MTIPARDDQDRRDEENRLWAHGIHIDDSIVQRGNYFLVAQSMLVVAYSILLSVSQQVHRLAIATTIIAIMGMVLAGAWGYVSWWSVQYLRHAAVRTAKRYGAAAIAASSPDKHEVVWAPGRRPRRRLPQHRSRGRRAAADRRRGRRPGAGVGRRRQARREPVRRQTGHRPGCRIRPGRHRIRDHQLVEGTRGTGKYEPLWASWP